jgi:hypothetical protein
VTNHLSYGAALCCTYTMMVRDLNSILVLFLNVIFQVFITDEKHFRLHVTYEPITEM